MSATGVITFGVFLLLACVFSAVLAICTRQGSILKYLVSMVVCLALGLCFLGIGAGMADAIKDQTFKEEKTVEFSKLFYHKAVSKYHEFSFVNLRGGLENLKVQDSQFYFNLPKDKIEFATLRISETGLIMTAEFHLHSLDSLHGGKWEKQVGKTKESGQTQVIE